MYSTIVSSALLFAALVFKLNTKKKYVKFAKIYDMEAIGISSTA